MKNKSKLLIAVILMIITLASISYAAFFVSKNQVNDNKVLSGCFDTTFTENSASINMTKALPLTNEQGLNTNPYSFTISNTCTINADYTILLNIKNNSFSDNYISYNYSGNEVNTLNTAQVNSNVPSGFAKSYILGAGTLKRGKSETINIKLWLNELADYQNMTNKTFEAEIQIVSTVSTNQIYGDITLAYTVDGEDTDMTVAELKAAGYEMYNVTCSDGSATIAKLENGKKTLDYQSLPAVCTVDFINIKNKLNNYGFAQLEYLESTGEQFIDTGLYLNDGFRATGKFFLKNIVVGKGSDIIIGKNGLGFGIWESNGTFYLSGPISKHGYTVTTNTMYSFDVSLIDLQNPIMIINNNTIPIEKYGEQTIETTSTVSIFGIIQSNNNSSIKLYELTLYSSIDNNNFISNFIPAKRESDGKLGLYDLVRNQFYTNQGTSEFISGPEI